MVRCLFYTVSTLHSSIKLSATCCCQLALSLPLSLSFVLPSLRTRQPYLPQLSSVSSLRPFKATRYEPAVLLSLYLSSDFRVPGFCTNKPFPPAFKIGLNWPLLQSSPKMTAVKSRSSKWTRHVDYMTGSRDTHKILNKILWDMTPY